MSLNPLVSVIIPTYNRFSLLREAIQSVLAQTVRDFELIIADDGSTDETPTLATLSGIRYVRIDHTGKPGLVRNHGAETAKGDYLAFLDSDDLWKPGKLARQIALFKERPELKITHTRELWLRNGREVSQSGQRHRRSGMIFKDALKKCTIGPSTVMLKKSLFMESGGFRDDLEIAEDYELWLRITAFHKVGYINRPLTVKRAGFSDQLSEKYGYIEYFRIKALLPLVESKFFPAEKQKLAEEELVKKCLIYAGGCRKRGKIEEATEYEVIASKYEDGN